MESIELIRNESIKQSNKKFYFIKLTSLKFSAFKPNNKLI